MSNILAKELSRFVNGLLDGDQEIVHTDAAETFIADNHDLLEQHFAEVVLRMIAAEIKNRTQAPAKAFGQGVLFAGLPAAVTVADGRTKPLKACTWADLQMGREFRIDNIDNAIEALHAYDEDLKVLAPQMEGTELTIADAIERLAA